MTHSKTACSLGDTPLIAYTKYMKHPIGTTLNGTPVYVDLINSAASANISQQPHLVTLIKELLESTNVSGTAPTVEYNFGRNIGNTVIVQTTEKDTIIYAKRLKQETFTRFVRRRVPAPTTYITISLSKDGDGEYALANAWIGRLIPPFPADQENEAQQSEAYWAQHALVLEGQPIQLRTVTQVYPY